MLYHRVVGTGPVDSAPAGPIVTTRNLS